MKLALKHEKNKYNAKCHESAYVELISHEELLNSRRGGV